MADEQRAELPAGTGYEIVELSFEELRRLLRFEADLELLDIEVRHFGGRMRDFDAAPGTRPEQRRVLRLKIAHALLPRYEPGQVVCYSSFGRTLRSLALAAEQYQVRNPMGRTALPLGGHDFAVPIDEPPVLPAGAESTA